jgi:hypothetical protein
LISILWRLRPGTRAEPKAPSQACKLLWRRASRLAAAIDANVRRLKLNTSTAPRMASPPRSTQITSGISACRGRLCHPALPATKGVWTAARGALKRGAAQCVPQIRGHAGPEATHDPRLEAALTADPRRQLLRLPAVTIPVQVRVSACGGRTSSPYARAPSPEF